MINDKKIDELHHEYVNNKPFSHVIIDNFWKDDVANNLLKEINEMPKTGMVTRYLTPLENKISIPHWDLFSETIYKAFTFLNTEFVSFIEKTTNVLNLKPDIGLHGGGLHYHPSEGNLNLHKDYSIHPKLGMMRKLNLIVYMNPIWKDEWNGNIEFWSHDKTNNSPFEKVKSIKPIFNRAVLFDVSQDGWHGLPGFTKQPKGVYRQSMAVYYMIDPIDNVERRPKALFAPRDEQKNDETIKNTILKRAGYI